MYVHFASFCVIPVVTYSPIVNWLLVENVWIMESDRGIGLPRHGVSLLQREYRMHAV